MELLELYCHVPVPRTSYDRSFYNRSFVLSFVLRSYDRSCLRIRSLVFTIARAYEYDHDRSCLRSLVLTIVRAYDRSCVRSLVLTIALIARSYDRSCLRSLVRTIARAYDRSCVRSLVIVLTIARDRAYDRSCLRSLVLTIARAYDCSARSCLRSLVLTIARAYGRSLVRTIVHTIDDRSIVLSIPLFDTTLVFVNTFNDVYSVVVVVLTVCTMKCILSLI